MDIKPLYIDDFSMLSGFYRWDDKYYFDSLILYQSDLDETIQDRIFRGRIFRVVQDGELTNRLRVIIDAFIRDTLSVATENVSGMIIADSRNVPIISVSNMVGNRMSFVQTAFRTNNKVGLENLDGYYDQP